MTTYKCRWLLAAVLAFSVLAPRQVWANSKFLNVQGKLTDGSGNPLTGTNTVTFRLYTSSTAAVATAFWTESLSISFSTGLYNVTLGNVTSLDSVAFNQIYYLGIQVSGDSNELSPRQVLGASAYAQGSLGGFNVGNDLAIAGQSIVMGSMTVQGAALVVGTVTVQANAFSAGGTGIVLSNGKVGFGTSSPQTTIDVNGAAQFGSTAKSTFTSSGALTLASGAALTLSGANGNLISAASVTASAFFGDGTHLIGFSTTNLSAIPAGTIFAFAGSGPPLGSVECDGTSYSTSTYPVLYGRIGCNWGCADSAHFNVPDLRGVFLRGWNHGISTTSYTGDPDAVTRSSIAVSGATGDNVGSYEKSDYLAHTHTYTQAVFSGSSLAFGGNGNFTTGNTGTSPTTGGRETRPKNANVLFAIKCDDSALASGTLYFQDTPLVLFGSNGYVSSQSSVTASALFGNDAMVGQLEVTSGGGANVTYGLTAGTGSFTNTSGSYSLTTSTGISILAGRLNLASGSSGIVFPDGTVQRTAAGSGTGDVIAGGNNSFTGNNTHAGQETMLAGSTWTIDPNTITGNWIFVSSSDTNGTNNVANTTQTFVLTNYTADTSSIAWKVEFNCFLSSSVALYATFNSDNGAHYNYANGRVTNAAGVGADGGTADHAIAFSGGVVNAANSGISGEIVFQTEQTLTKNIVFYGRGELNQAGAYNASSINGGLYSGTTTPTQINFMGGAAASSAAPSHAGFLNCHMDLFRKGFQHL